MQAKWYNEVLTSIVYNDKVAYPISSETVLLIIGCAVHQTNRMV